MRRESHVRFGGRAGETHRSKDGRALRSDPYTKLLGPTKWTYFYLYVVLDIFSRGVAPFRWTVNSLAFKQLVDYSFRSLVATGSRG